MGSLLPGPVCWACSSCPLSTNTVSSRACAGDLSKDAREISLMYITRNALKYKGIQGEERECGREEDKDNGVL